MMATRLIVVEDERIVALHLKQQLAKLGYDVVAVAAAGETALDRIIQLTPDLVLMDIHIEGVLDGIEVARQIPPALEIPVIYVTAYSEQATLDRARETRPYGYLVKPFSERELHATIQMALERRKADSALRSAERGLERLNRQLEREIAERSRFEQQIIRERDTAQRYLDVAGVMILVLDLDGTVRMINRHGARLLGHAAPQEIIGRDWIDSFVPRRLRAAARAAQEAVIDGDSSRPAFYQTVVLTRTGEERVIAWHETVLADEDGAPVGTLSSGDDITDRLRVEADLRASEERFRSIFSAASEGIFILDLAAGSFSAVNEAGAALFGYDAPELIGRDFAAISSGEAPYTGSQAMVWIERAAATGRAQHVDWRCRARNGRLMWSEMSLRYAVISGRRVVLAIVRDVTERREIEAKLRQAQKMEAIGLLTGGIAHDFNNLLAVIRGNLELLKDSLAADPELDEMAEDALKATSQGASLTHQLLAYSRQQPLAPKVVGLAGLVADLTKLLRRTLGEAIEIRKAIPADLWPVRVDPNQLENALLNLALNARDAMPNGGRLTIEGMNRVTDEAFLEQAVDIAPGRYVELSVSDNGCGMPKEIAERVLEPFFTTKSVGRGTGLGLSMVYGFAKQSGGHLKIYSEPGQGTTVSLYLPQAPEAADEGEAAGGGTPIPTSRGGEVVLVLEDDDAVRKFAVRVLTGLGYRTLQAANGAEALGMLEGSERIDLLLTDVALPGGLSGPAVARQAKALRPRLGLLFMSGYAKEAMLQQDVLDEGIQLLTKPFPKDELARRIRDVLDEARDGS